MSCKKPSGDPRAISEAAQAIVRYAAGVDQIFSAIERGGGLEPFWRGESARQASGQLAGYSGHLDDYSAQLRDYAAQLESYAESLAREQRCDIWDILTWVFLIVFAIVEIVCGFFIGGILEGAFAALFGAVAEYAMDAIGTAVTVIDDVLDAVGTLGRFGAEVASESSTVSDALVSATRFIAVDSERVLVEAQKQVTSALMKTADNLVQTYVVRGLSSLDPQNGGAADESGESDAENAAILFASALVGGAAGTATTRLLTLSPGLLTDVFSDVAKDLWTNLSLESITAEANGTPFDAHDLWYRTVWGLGKALVKAPGKRLVATMSPGSAGPGTSPLAKELGDLPINDGFGLARKGTSELVGGPN